MRIIVALLVVTHLPASAGAEFRCAGQVSYHWETAEKKESQSAIWKNIEAVGADEEIAKQQYAKKKSDTELEALGRCRAKHENYAECYSGRYAQLSSKLAGISFSGRRQFEEALKAECDGLRGRCTKAEGTEPTCGEVKLVAPTPTPEAAADPKGAEKKK